MRVTLEAMGQLDISIDPSGTLIIEQFRNGKYDIVEVPTYARVAFLNSVIGLIDIDETEE